MKTGPQQNEASAISWVARVSQLKPKPVTEPLSATRRDPRLAKGCELIGTVFLRSQPSSMARWRARSVDETR